MSPRPPRLAAADIATALAGLPDWTLSPNGNAITRTFTFKDFSAAFGFMARAALAAEKLDHHPDWTNVWNRVAVTLTTHDAGGLTALDMQLAGVLSALAAQA
jgi:4a-hydroxytetrahydrobiopterin dehydratase